MCMLFELPTKILDPIIVHEFVTRGMVSIDRTMSTPRALVHLLLLSAASMIFILVILLSCSSLITVQTVFAGTKEQAASSRLASCLSSSSGLEYYITYAFVCIYIRGYM